MPGRFTCRLAIAAATATSLALTAPPLAHRHGGLFIGIAPPCAVPSDAMCWCTNNRGGRTYGHAS
jgi:hypothetical protein